MQAEKQEYMPLLGFFRSLTMPAVCLMFLLVIPSNIYMLIGFMLLPNTIDFLKCLHFDDLRHPQNTQKPIIFDSIPALHFVFHIFNLFLALKMVRDYELFSLQTFVGLWLLIQSSSLSAPTVGHELIHRRSKLKRWMGRILLSTVFYEHFYTEHIRGHHRNVGRYMDYSTARLGESFIAFMSRSVPGQFRHALLLERRRLAKRHLFYRLAHNAVYQGLVIELAFLWAAYLIAGGPGLSVFIVHGIVVHILSQTFNYLLHWGLRRRDGDTASSAHLSWDCNDQNVLFTMLSITRHAQHHAMPSKAFYKINYMNASPKIPEGLVKTFWLILFRNSKFRALMTEELIRLNLISEKDLL